LGRLLRSYVGRYFKYNCSTLFFFFFFQALNFLVESFGLLNDLFPLPTILDAGYPVFDLDLADVLFDVILQSVFGSSL
jgi:hypothetical protein